MRLSTRLILPLLATVLVVMSLHGVSALRDRQANLQSEARRATHAYATALGLALGGAIRAPRPEGVQDIVDRISEEPEIYGVVVYGPDAEVRFSSDLLRDAPSPRARVRAVLESDEAARFERVVEENRVYSVIQPLRDPAGDRLGAFEVAQPLSFVEAEKSAIRQRFLLNTATLVVAVSVLIYWLVRRMIARPLAEFVHAARALARGELTHRMRLDPRGGELAELALEFNRMADSVQGARAELLAETEQRLSLEQRLRRTEKMAAIGKLAAGLAHEIAAPLNVVVGRAEMLQRKELDRGLQQRNLGIIIDQIGRITVIVRNLLDFARRREPRIRPHDLADVLDGVLEFLEGEFERAEIRIQRSSVDDAWVLGDPNLLHQVFINLLLNSVHALEGAAGEKTIRIAVTRAPERIAGQPELLSVEVSDSGPGIPEDHLGQVFEPFFTTKSGGEGTGLGLAVVRGIVEEHGGSIVAGNRSGGALFRFTIPAAPEVARV